MRTRIDEIGRFARRLHVADGTGRHIRRRKDDGGGALQRQGTNCHAHVLQRGRRRRHEQLHRFVFVARQAHRETGGRTEAPGVLRAYLLHGRGRCQQKRIGATVRRHSIGAQEGVAGGTLASRLCGGGLPPRLAFGHQRLPGRGIGLRQRLGLTHELEIVDVNLAVARTRGEEMETRDVAGLDLLANPRHGNLPALPPARRQRRFDAESLLHGAIRADDEALEHVASLAVGKKIDGQMIEAGPVAAAFRHRQRHRRPFAKTFFPRLGAIGQRPRAGAGHSLHRTEYSVRGMNLHACPLFRRFEIQDGHRCAPKHA